MSLLASLTKCSVFESYDEILLLIRQFKEENNVYLRLDKPLQTVKSWNKSVKIEDKKIDEKYVYKECTYVCPHSVSRKPRQTKNMRVEQNIMYCECPVRIHFRFNLFKKNFEIVKMELDHKNHPISELHIQTYARKSK
jgi:hypothetical protein